VSEYVEHLAQLKMRKDKKKEESKRELMERLKREYNDFDWVGLYSSSNLSSSRSFEGGRAFPITRSPSEEES